MNLILRSLWDPIGCGVPLDEYEGYAAPVAGLLERGADADEIQAALYDIRTKTIGVQPNDDVDAEAATKIVDWYATRLRDVDV